MACFCSANRPLLWHMLAERFERKPQSLAVAMAVAVSSAACCCAFPSDHAVMVMASITESDAFCSGRMPPLLPSAGACLLLIKKDNRAVFNIPPLMQSSRSAIHLCHRDPQPHLGNANLL